MSPSRPLQLGNVVWAELEDANGYRRVRPVAVVTPTADIDAGQPVRVVAITTRLPDPLPEDHVVLPWDRQGKARSGSRRRCAALAGWQAGIAVGDLQQVLGNLSPPVIRELLGKVSAALSLRPPDPTPGPADPAAGPRSTRRRSPLSRPTVIVDRRRPAISKHAIRVSPAVRNVRPTRARPRRTLANPGGAVPMEWVPHTSECGASHVNGPTWQRS